MSIDLAVGVYYTATRAVELSASAFAMFNAIWIAVLLYLWRPVPSTSGDMTLRTQESVG